MVEQQSVTAARGSPVDVQLTVWIATHDAIVDDVGKIHIAARMPGGPFHKGNLPGNRQPGVGRIGDWPERGGASRKRSTK